jgi:hypothetical protein
MSQRTGDRMGDPVIGYPKPDRIAAAFQDTRHLSTGWQHKGERTWNMPLQESEHRRTDALGIPAQISQIVTNK